MGNFTASTLLTGHWISTYLGDCNIHSLVNISNKVKDMQSRGNCTYELISSKPESLYGYIHSLTDKLQKVIESSNQQLLCRLTLSIILENLAMNL